MQYNKYVLAMRSLSLQALNKSKSGHTGMAMSASTITYTLYTRFVNISSHECKWLNRDRFVLSGGHGCLSIYTIFHFAKLIDKEEFKKFRNDSKYYPGHPEFEDYNWVDASTGPLGQGISNAVGMALAQKYLQSRWAPIAPLIDHYTYCVCGDGDLQEGISYEAMSVAGKLKLNKLIVLHDSNSYQLDSAVNEVNSESLKLRVEAQNWNYMSCESDVEKITEAIKQAQQSSDKPTFIEVKTIIGEGTTAQASNNAHGLAVSDQELQHCNEFYGLDYKNFEFPEEIYNHFYENVTARGNKKYEEWKKTVEEYLIKEPKLTNEFLSNFKGEFDNFSKYLDISDVTKLNDATKTYLKSFFKQLSDCQDILTLSADLAATTNCKIGDKAFNNDLKSPYVMMGVREFSMAGIQNGILYHGGLKSFAGTFLSFVDYAKSAIRVGAMAKLPSNWILTHDTYKVGADGPTHQPYDQIPMLRAIDNVYVLRPCDEKETLGAINLCLDNKNKTYCLVLTRQGLQSGYETSINNVAKGAYVIYEDEDPDITLVASGSEVELVMKSIESIKDAYHLNLKVVSCPSLKIFLNQDSNYIKSTLKSRNGVVTVEASSDTSWYLLNNYAKKVVTLRATTFGTSANGDQVYAEKGFNVENVVKKCQELINK